MTTRSSAVTPFDLTPEQRARISEAVAIAALSALFVEGVRWAFELAKEAKRKSAEACLSG